MGLSSKQVSVDGLDWSQNLLQNSGLELPMEQPHKTQGKKQQRQQEALKCPRCDSTNTKFCYYNNYNQSQPRHFCKTCKRHWTKGGTLRNVPVGGGRKNKRIKRTTTPESIPDNSANPQMIPTVPDQNPFNEFLYNSNSLLQSLSFPNNPISSNGFMGSVPLSPLLPLPCFPSQTIPYEESSFNIPDRRELYIIDTDPLFDNRKQRHLLYPSLSDLNPPPLEEQVPTTPWQLSATSLLEPDSSFWNAADNWALLSNFGVSDAKQEESNLTTEEGFQEI